MLLENVGRDYGTMNISDSVNFVQKNLPYRYIYMENKVLKKRTMSNLFLLKISYNLLHKIHS